MTTTTATLRMDAIRRTAVEFARALMQEAQAALWRDVSWGRDRTESRAALKAAQARFERVALHASRRGSFRGQGVVQMANPRPPRSRGSRG